MRFLTSLRSGASVENVGLEFVQLLLNKSWCEDKIDLDMACDFVNDILLTIGLDCAITPEQIHNGGTYVWPMEQIQIYSFHYIEMDFGKIEEFLIKICALVQTQNDIFNNHLQETDDLQSPVVLLMQLVAIWCNASKQLLALEELQVNKRFEEPFARINYHLLLGLHELRKLYRTDLKLLDAICNRLYWSAKEGLYYRQTHDMIFSGLLEIFSESYDLFYSKSATTINFFYEAFAVEINNMTPFKLYKSLKDMLLDEEAPSNKQNILLNFLIEPYMLDVYFTTFMVKYKWHKKTTKNNIEKIQQESLKFLSVLQSKLVSLDCFSREFMEAILNLVFKSDNITSSLSCCLYISMMKRKFPEQMILNYIMDFYVAHVGKIHHLKTCIHALFDGFENLLKFNNLLEMITNSQIDESIRLSSAHIFVLVFELKTRKKDSDTKRELQHTLEILPEFFENLFCQKSEGILLKVYNFLPLEKLEKPVVDNFIHYAMGIFTYADNSLEYPLLMNIFCIFHKFLMYNKEWRHLELLSEHLFQQYQEMLKTLKPSLKNPTKAISVSFLETTNNLLKRLNIVLKLKYDLLDDSYLIVIRNLFKFIMYNTDMQLFINEHKFLTDVYVIEIIMSCLLKLYKKDNVFLPEAEELFAFLWSMMGNIEEFIKFPVVKVKTYFCCFVQLIIQSPAKLNNQNYHQLIQILIEFNFKKKFVNQKAVNELQQLHPLQSVEYKHLMLRLFTEMHKYQNIEVNTNIVWKLCIYYGMFRHKYQEDLRQLLITLANYRLKICKHIIAVIIYNIYKQTPALPHVTIITIIKKYKHLIDKDIKIESTQLLNVHVVLSVLQILEKALSVQRIETDHNRLEALRDINLFIEDLDLNRLQAKHLLLEQLERLNQHLLDAEENKLLLDFKEMLNK